MSQNTVKIVAPIRAEAMAHTSPSVGTSSATVAAAKANRMFLCIQNTYTTAVYVQVGATATTTEGLKIEPGDSYTWDVVVPTGVVNAIRASGTGDVVVVEG